MYGGRCAASLSRYRIADAIPFPSLASSRHAATDMICWGMYPEPATGTSCRSMVQLLLHLTGSATVRIFLKKNLVNPDSLQANRQITVVNCRAVWLVCLGSRSRFWLDTQNYAHSFNKLFHVSFGKLSRLKHLICQGHLCSPFLKL